MRIIQAILFIVGVIQIVCGAVYLANPSAVGAMLGPATAVPPWVGFVLATAGARFIGYGIGMLAAAKDPQRQHLWITTMIGVQSVDLIATLFYSANGTLASRHFAPGAAFPLLWVVLLGWISLRIRTKAPTAETSTQPPTRRAES